MKKSPPLPYGYYVFLGIGDYHQPEALNADWIATWGLKEWQAFIEKLLELKANTLMIYINGHSLPYQSHIYPELIDDKHPNVKNEFFSEVLHYAKKLGLDIILALTTTGHSAKYLEKNPNLAIKVRSREINLDKLLVPFPDHIRKTKNLAQNGHAQVGLGTLCHNNLSSQKYAINLAIECLSIYNNINGVALHPPESIYPCFCDHCYTLFSKKYGDNLLETSDEVAREFYLESYLDFQKNHLEREIKSLHPKIQLYTFTIPWLFENSFEKVVNYISQDMIIIDWDYNLNNTRMNQLHERLLRYQMRGHRVYFMPTTGFGFRPDQPIQSQANKVKRQMQLAIDSKVSGLIHFVGPTIAEDLERTNLYS